MVSTFDLVNYISKIKQNKIKIKQLIKKYYKDNNEYLTKQNVKKYLQENEYIIFHKNTIFIKVNNDEEQYLVDINVDFLDNTDNKKLFENLVFISFKT